MQKSRPALFVDTTLFDIRSKCNEIPSTEGIEGGVICTGFIDVEKILRRVTYRHGNLVTKHFFLEKKLPFQLLLLTFDDDKDEFSGNDSSGSDHSDGDDSGSNLSDGESSGTC